MNILVINAGSSSLKYQLMDPATGAVSAKGLCERIGIDGKFTYKPQVEGKQVLDAVDVAMPTHSEAIQTVLDALLDAETGVISSMDEIDAVGHRVVHGGEKFAKSVLITDEVMAAIEECNPLAPLHNPANLIGIRACAEIMPGVPMVAVFDTAFHQTMPAKAYRYALPKKYYTDLHMRKYGFHGTSHRYIAGRATELLGEGKKVVVLRLWNNGGKDSLNNEILAKLEKYFPKPWFDIFSKNSSNNEILAKLGKHIPQSFVDESNGMKIGNNIFVEYGDKFDWPDLTAPEGGSGVFCHGLRDQVGILCDGTVVPCCLDHDGDLSLGNLLESDLKEILESDRAKAIYNGFQNRYAAEELCRRCGYARRFR